MELRRVECCESPRDSGSLRLRGEVAYADGSAEEYWFDVTGARPEDLSGSGNPWLACLAPLAVTIGEPLRLNLPVDALLLENAGELLRIWTAWYPDLRMVPIEADGIDEDARTDRRGTLSFFSGGVDSFFTALRHAAGAGTPRTEPIDSLLFIHGYDIAIDNARAHAAVLPVLQDAASALGLRLLRIATNIRQTRFGEADWSGLSHGAALAATGLVLEPGFETMLIPSSAGYRDLRFWGSHPLTDPLFSTSGTRVVHDGPAFMRAEKTEHIARSEVALRTLRVCWRSEDGRNCCACNNCYRTMLTLEALGALERCSTFDRERLDLRQAARVYCPASYDVRQFGYVRDLALREGRADIAGAVERSLAGSAVLSRWIHAARKLRSVRGLWRLARPLEKRFLRGWLV